jgi:hypothetical protein
MLFLAQSSCATVSTLVSTGRIYNGRHTHVGVRPSFSDGVYVTVQVTTDAVP